MKTLSLIFALLLATGCAGEFEMFSHGEDGPVQITDVPGNQGNNGGSTDDGPGTVTEQLQPGFSFEREEVRLLPFHTRALKLAAVTGLSTDDPLFDQLNRSRYDLGDHNYGQGVGPDLSWNATKMATWVRALRPVCASDVMAESYALPEQTSELMTAAYGRVPAADEVDELRGAVDAQQLDEAGQYEAICLSVLTSAEFVAQ